MKKIRCLFCVALLAGLVVSGCGQGKKEVKIGVSFGAGPAVRWDYESEYMQEHAEELGAEIEVRMNRTDEPKTQKEDCFEMIDSGIDALILMPRDATKAGEILAYAKEKEVPVISYARVILGEPVDLFVGYDSERVGQRMGQYITEAAYEGDYIILKGDEQDNNATLLYDGAMRYIDPIRANINVILEEAVPGWDPELAKQMIVEAVNKNNGKVDAILSPNDKIAGAAREALIEAGVETPVIITGMDAELDAAKRIIADTQSMTVYMDLRELANTAIDEAYHMGAGEKVNVNAEFDNRSGGTIPSNLITGQVVTKENLDRLLIDSGYFTKAEVYE